MVNYARAPDVDGFKRISFWREGEIGIITLLPPGTIDKMSIAEFIQAISIADNDDKVRALVVTGSNYVFSKGLSLPENITYADLRDYYDSVKALAVFLISLEKPIFSAVNGTASNNGLALALLCDEVFYSDNTKITLTDDEPRILLSSISYPRLLRSSGNGLRIEGVKLSESNMMKDVMDISENLLRIPYHIARKERFKGFETVLLQEEIDFLDFYLWCEGCRGKN
jgi:hypothetical protein